MAARKLSISAFFVVLAIFLTGSQCASVRRTPSSAGQLYKSALEDLQKHRFEEAKYNFKKIYSDYPNSDYADNALFRLGYIACVQEEYLLARDYFGTLVGEHPKSEWAFDAKTWLGLLNSWVELSRELEEVRDQLGVVIDQSEQNNTAKDIEDLQNEISRLQEENRKLRELIETLD